jgi:hypothetical protein
VASALGYEAQWTKLKQIRAQLIGIAAIEAGQGGQAASAVRLDAGAE